MRKKNKIIPFLVLAGLSAMLIGCGAKNGLVNPDENGPVNPDKTAAPASQTNNDEQLAKSDEQLADQTKPSAKQDEGFILDPLITSN